MSKKEQEAKKNEIYNNKEYLDLFSKVANENQTDEQSNEYKILKEAFRIALDTRKFEIELYWKRASYFWVITASVFTGYAALEKIGEGHMLAILLAFLGYNFSLAWYFVNRGSKFWQENWEYHVSQLEERFIGPLYKVIKYPESNFFNITKEYPFSVSRVNQLLSLLMIFVWIVLIAYPFCLVWDETSKVMLVQKDIKNVWIPLLVALGNGLIFFYLSRSFIGKDKCRLDKQYKNKKIVIKGKKEPKPIPEAIVKK